MLDKFNFQSNPPQGVAGVYLFTSPDKDIIYYVGMSYDLASRLSAHTVPSFLKAKGIPFSYGWHLGAGYIYHQEMKYIKVFKPLLNSAHNDSPSTALREEYQAHKRTASAVFNIDARLSHLINAMLIGERLIELREDMRKAGHSFDDYLIKVSSVKKTQAYEHIKLAKNWDVVLALGMLETNCSKTLNKSMRLCRTLKIIHWYNEAKKSGRPEAELTLEQYWIEQEKPAGPTKRELQSMNQDLQITISILQNEIAYLREEIARLKDVPDKPRATLKFNPPVFA
jgi:hypothetical protein